MKLIDLIIKEFLAIVEYLKDKAIFKDNKIIINSKAFYTLLGKNLYITRKEKLDIYKQLNFIICNSNGLTSVVYDKESKTTSRKIVLNYETYLTLKKIYETEYTI